MTDSADRVFDYIERFTTVLVAAGMPPMPSRVFVALLVADGRMSAAELASTLHISAGAVSGAVRYLVPLGLVTRERVPGSRRDYYRVPSDVWTVIMRMRDQVMDRWTAMVREGIEMVGASTAAGRRMAEHAEFFEFVTAELDGVLKRWEQRRSSPGVAG
jgi:DNA-binding transcriptional regulator GbsR (MarR family)